MDNHKLFGLLYPLLKLYVRLYYVLVHFLFSLYHAVFSSSRAQWIAAPPDGEGCELLLLSATQAAERIRCGELSAKALVEACIERTRAVDAQLNAVVHENYAEALEDAERVDKYLAKVDRRSEEFKALAYAKPLLGVPFVSKDNLRTKGFVCIAGNPKYAGNEPSEEDADAVGRLRDAGAILVAVSNLPMLAMAWDSANAVSGATLNPYDRRRIPGGSSGGTAALLASGAAAIGLGNDMAGSVRIPSHFCGVFGLKPGEGVVSLDGMVPEVRDDYCRRLWNVGPMCRYAEDLELLFTVLVGDQLASERFHLGGSGKQQRDFRRVRLFYMEELNTLAVEDVHDEQRQALRRAVKYFEYKFERSAQRVDFPIAHHALELWVGWRYGKQQPPTSRQLASQLWSIVTRQSEMTLTGWAFGAAGWANVRSEEDRKFLHAKREKLRRQVSDLLGDDGLLLLPSLPTTAPFHHQNLLTIFNIMHTGLWNAVGLPAVVCPLGLSPTSGLPLGVQLVGAPDQEALLMAAARELERGFGGWTAPWENDKRGQ